MMRRRMTTMIAGLAALALAIPAVASPSADSGNTLIEHGYDAEKMEVLFTVLDAEEAEEAGDYECALPEADPATDGDGTTPTDEELSNAVPVSSDGVVDDDGEAEKDDTDEGAKQDADGADDSSFECVLTAVDATGPNGQVNHGQVVSSVVHALKDMGYRGIGCIVRVFAKSDYGKGDHQVKPAQDDSEHDDSKADDSVIGDIKVEPVDEGTDADELAVDLEQTFTDCNLKRDKDRDDDRDKKDREYDRDEDRDKKDREYDRDEDRDKQDREYDRDEDRDKKSQHEDSEDESDRDKSDKDKSDKDKSGKNERSKGKSDEAKAGKDERSKDEFDKGGKSNGRSDTEDSRDSSEKGKSGKDGRGNGKGGNGKGRSGK
jgi:hypothetical protein